MARAKTQFQQFTFAKGKITEATPFTFPENAVLDINNVDIFTDGSARRRPGVQLEDNAQGSAVSFPEDELGTSATSSFVWKAVGGTAGTNFLVVQAGNVLSFYDADKDTVSDNLKGVLDLSGLAANRDPSVTSKNVLQIEAGIGFLFVVGEQLEPLLIEWDGTNFSTTQITIEIRDFTGVDDGLGLDERPATLSNEHEYNLMNQGWPNEDRTVSSDANGTGVTTANPITYTNTVLGSFPASADFYTLAFLQASDSSDAIEAFYPGELDKINIPLTEPPKGHFILDYFDKNRSTVSSILDTDLDESISDRPTSVGFFSGRVFYGHHSTILFSRVVSEKSDAGKCYQKQDPTAKDFNDLLANDGGVIEIPEMSNASKLLAVDRSLLVFADNGVWQISGGVDGVFSANNFSIYKVTSKGIKSPQSAIFTGERVFYWSEDGIIVLVPEPSTGRLQVENITTATIQTTYDSITSSAKDFAVAAYDGVSNKIYWFYYGDEDFDPDTQAFSFKDAIVLDLTLGAFYQYSFSTSSIDVHIAGAFFSSNLKLIVFDQSNVTVDGEDVVVGEDNVVVGFSFTFGELKNTDTWIDFKDFFGLPESSEGVYYPSYVETAYIFPEDVIRDKRGTYVHTFFDRSEDQVVTNSEGDLEFDRPSECHLEARWDFTRSTANGKSQDLGNVYRFPRNVLIDSTGDVDDKVGYGTIHTKNRIRGKGNALTLRFSDAGFPNTQKDFQLLGYAIPITYREVP